MTDVRKTADLLAAGNFVVRLREDDLPPLGISHASYREVRVYSTSPNPETANGRNRELDGRTKGSGGRQSSEGRA